MPGLDENVVYNQFGKTAGSPKTDYNLKAKNLDFDSSDDNRFRDTSLMAAIYKTHFKKAPVNEETGRFYIDVRFNFPERFDKLYSPFLRFAVARFQEKSINTVDKNGEGLDSRFSKITLADFVQIPPHRSLKIENGKLIYEATVLRSVILREADRSLSNYINYSVGGKIIG